MVEMIKEQLSKYPGLTYLTDEIRMYKSSWNRLYKYGMVLFGPDSFKQNEVSDIIDFLQNKDFRMVAVTIRRISRTQTENLFLPTSTCMECGTLKWWMIQDAAMIGEFAAVIFYSEKATSEMDCLTLLNRFKGNSNPLNNTEGVVRYDFNAINVCLNLIHIPDIYGDFFKDTNPFYNISELKELVNKPVEQKNNLRDKYKHEFFLIELYSKSESYYKFELLIYKIKYLLVNSLDNSKNDVIYFKDYYMRMYKEFEKINNRQETYSLFVENIKKEMESISKYQDFLIQLISKNERNKNKIYRFIREYEICILLCTITDPDLFKQYQYKKDYFLQLEAFNIYIDPLEKLIANTSLIQWKHKEGN